jgi:hypothetical protein
MLRAQDRAGAFKLAGGRRAGRRIARKPCSRPGSIVSHARITAGNVFKKKAAMKVEAAYQSSSGFTETRTTTAPTLNLNATRPGRIARDTAGADTAAAKITGLTAPR